MTAVLLGIAVAAVFGAVGVAKVLALEPMPTMARHLGFSVAAYRRIGALELAGAAGVLLGLWQHPLGLAAAVGLIALLIGGILSHLRIGDHPGRILVPVVTSIMVLGYALAL